MSSTRKVAAVLLLLALALGFALLQARRAREASSAVLSAQRQRDELKRQLQRVESQLAKKAEREQLERPNPEAAPPPVAATITNSTPERPADQANRQYYSLIASDPTLREIYLRRASVITNYGPKFWALKLTREQMEWIKANNIENEAAKLDLIASAEAHGLSMKDPSIKKMADALDAGLMQHASEIFGPAMVARYLAFAPDYPLQIIADGVAGRVYLTDTPLTLDQEQRLVSILRENKALLNGDRIAADAVMAQVRQAGFSPAQIAALGQIVQLRQAEFQMNEMTDSAIQRHPSASAPIINIKPPSLPQRAL